MSRGAWPFVLAVALACGDDDGGTGGTNDGGTAVPSDGGTITDGGLRTEAARTCTSQTTQQARVACAANALLATLNDAQKASVGLALTDYVNRSKWSNFPVMLNKGSSIHSTRRRLSRSTSASCFIPGCRGIGLP